MIFIAHRGVSDAEFFKHNHKLLDAGRWKTDRIEKFNELLASVEKYRRKNSYEICD